MAELTRVTKQEFLIEEECLTIGESRPRPHKNKLNFFFNQATATATAAT
jgi:hypothetical protein